MKRLAVVFGVFFLILSNVHAVSSDYNDPEQDQQQTYEVDPEKDHVGGGGGGVPYRLFRAEGVHICWSDKVIGNQCFVSGTNYTDCLQAYFNLKQWDCCRNTPGSNSINFVMQKCTQW